MISIIIIIIIIIILILIIIITNRVHTIIHCRPIGYIAGIKPRFHYPS